VTYGIQNVLDTDYHINCEVVNTDAISPEATLVIRSSFKLTHVTAVEAGYATKWPADAGSSATSLWRHKICLFIKI